MKQHFVTFYSPGTFTSETTSKQIDEWDTATALVMAMGIVERYGAKPYAFRFTTRENDGTALDSKETASSPLHYFGVKVETLDEIEARNDPKESILRSNMRGNGYDRVAVPIEGWRGAYPLGKDDVVL